MMIYRPLAARRGSTLVLSLIVVLVVGMMAGSFMQLNSAATRRQALAVDNKLAFYISEAGLTEGYLALLSGKSGDIGSAESPAIYGDGLVWVEATHHGDGMVEMASTGFAGRASTKLSAVFASSTMGAARFGVFSQQDLILPAGTAIDGYDSSMAEEESASFGQSLGGSLVGGLLDVLSGEEVPPPVLARVASNGNIVVNSDQSQPTSLTATLASGPLGSVTFVGDPVFVGEKFEDGLEVVLPTLTLPRIEQAGDRSVRSGTPVVIDAGAHGFNDVVVGAETMLQLNGPLVLVVDSLTLMSSASLLVDERLGAVQIYVRNEVDFQAGSRFDQVGRETENFELLIAGTGASTLAASGELHGLVYAPNGSVNVGAGTELFGSLVAESLSLDRGVSLHFDAHLARTAASSLLPRLISWRIDEMSNLGTASSDPFVALGVERDDCVRLSESSVQPTLRIEYWNKSKNRIVFDGLWDDFQGWTNILEIISLARDGVPLTAEEAQKIVAYAQHLDESVLGLTDDLLAGLLGG
ncbi:MAG: hypothetical protein WD226_02245 [Planctomycetota bacterium]